MRLSCRVRDGKVAHSAKQVAYISYRDPLIMQQTVALCKMNSVEIGAHPGLPDSK
jgi:lactam utilization protein B